MRLELSKQIVQKIEYFSKYFSSKEWSGPAWFKATGKKNTFPEVFELKHFHPLDLGSTAATEFEAEDVAKILPDTYKALPSLKTCYMGLIHSHHNMGAYFSSSDEETLCKMGPETGFYPSLVVATSKTEYAFAVSYKDQYGFPQWIETEEIHIPAIKVKPEWKAQCEQMAKANAKPKWQKNGYGSYLNPNQIAIRGAYPTYKSITQLKDKEVEHLEEVAEKYSSRKMTYVEFKDECAKYSVNPMDVINGGGYDLYGGY